MADAMFRASLKAIRNAQEKARKPLAIILAGHNGSGKSTLWYEVFADDLQIPLINADRMMLADAALLVDNIRAPTKRWDGNPVNRASSVR
jgi:predicted ATPase